MIRTIESAPRWSTPYDESLLQHVTKRLTLDSITQKEFRLQKLADTEHGTRVWILENVFLPSDREPVYRLEYGYFLGVAVVKRDDGIYTFEYQPEDSRMIKRPPIERAVDPNVHWGKHGAGPAPSGREALFSQVVKVLEDADGGDDPLPLLYQNNMLERRLEEFSREWEKRQS